MNILGWVTLALTIIGSFFAAAKLLSGQVAQLLVQATIIKEKVSLSQVGIDALKMRDDDIVARIEHLERRCDDAERYLQVYTQKAEHPFVMRNRDR